MKRGWMKRAGGIVAVGGLVALAAPAQGAALPQQNDAECQCVDADGNRIEDCTCFRMPRFEMAFAPFSARPRLGISVDGDQPSSIDAQGAEVASVLDDGPADEAGLERGDIITRINGQSLLSPLAAEVEEDFDEDESLPVQRLLSIARGLEPGEQVEIEYLRDGERRAASLEARELSRRNYAFSFDPEQIRVGAERMREDAERMREQARAMGERMRYEFRGGDPVVVPAPPAFGFFGGPMGSRYGIELIELNEGLGTYFGTSEGVLVTEVDEDSALGLRPGDVILRVGDREATSPGRVVRLLETYEDGEQVTFRIRRDGAETSVMGRLER